MTHSRSPEYLADAIHHLARRPPAWFVDKKETVHRQKTLCENSEYLTKLVILIVSISDLSRCCSAIPAGSIIR